MRSSPIRTRLNISELEADSLERILEEQGFDLCSATTEELSGDGSDRRFIRLSKDGQKVVAVLPALHDPRSFSEAAAFCRRTEFRGHCSR